MNKLTLLVLSLLLFAITSSAQAFDKGVYVGASVGQADVSVTLSSNNIDFKDSDTAYKVLLGVRPLKWFGVEASYVDMGKPANSNYSATANGISAFAVGFLIKGQWIYSRKWAQSTGTQKSPAVVSNCHRMTAPMWLWAPVFKLVC